MRILFFLVFLILILLSDFYTEKAIGLILPISWQNSPWISYFFYGFKIGLWLFLFGLFILKPGKEIQEWGIITFFSIYGGQLILLIFSFGDEFRRGLSYLIQNISSSPKTGISSHSLNPIPRSEFLAKTGLGLGALASIGISVQGTKGLYDYRIRKVDLFLPNLPSEFNGITLVQISDIHSGSFYNPLAVQGGIDMILGLKPEMIFFTGDLVNSRSAEMKDYQAIFSKLNAPLGVFSILGNHDYGDYAHWNSPEEKKANLNQLIQIHKLMGYDLLMNENRKIRIGNQEISVLGIENWSARPEFPKHGRLDLAIKGTEESPVKLLLSHDPSHWRGQVIPEFKQVDISFSGHTHGMQMGIRLDHFQWSPIQYVYPEWAGLYREGNQQLYVNVGYGFLGYPGRIGMLPEITHFTLRTGNGPKV